MKKRLIIGSSVSLILVSVIFHFLIKEHVIDTKGDLLDFLIGAMFGAGITLPIHILDDKFKG